MKVVDSHVCPRKSQLDSVSMVALTPGKICHQTITFLTPEKKVSLSSEYSQKSEQVEESWVGTLSIWLRAERGLSAHLADDAKSRAAIQLDPRTQNSPGHQGPDSLQLLTLLSFELASLSRLHNVTLQLQLLVERALLLQ